MSSTVDKALSLLELFSPQQPQIGLSDVSRQASIDKATAHRLLSSLARRGFLEQDEASRLYRLGVSVIRLARHREASFPLESVVQAELWALQEATGETSHASMLAGRNLATIGYVPGNKAIHVTLEPGQLLPLHATASGLACMAFMQDGELRDVLARSLDSFTQSTPSDAVLVKRLVDKVRKSGFATADQTFESDVFGIAAPIFGPSGHARGAVAVATPAHRMTRDLKADTALHVMQAASRITRKLGAEPPASFLDLLRKAAA